MFENVENLKIISAVKKISKPYGKIEKRRTYSICFRVTGAMRYFFGNESIVVNSGEIIFIPKGYSYEYKRECEEDTVCMIINLDGNFGDVKHTVFPVNDFYIANNLSKTNDNLLLLHGNYFYIFYFSKCLYIF